MSKNRHSHPDGDRLMRYCDGELPATDSADVRRHLEACWDCRAELDRIQKTISECVEYRQAVLREHLPPPPEPWKDIYVQMGRIDDQLAPPSLWRNIADSFRSATRLRFALPAGAAAALLVGFVLFRETPAVQAAELLQRAAQAERTAPRQSKRLQIRTRTASFTRLLPAAGPSPVAALFEAARYDWQDPLSVRSYGAWRDGLAAKSDEVIENRESYLIRTQTTSGELREASMTLRRADLHAVQGTFVFRDNEWVELTELEPEATQTAALSSITPLAPAPKAPSIAEPIAPATAATESDELKVWALLHRLQADLGEPVEITRAEGKVRVGGIGIAPERQQELIAGLGSLPNVVVRFDDPTQSPAPASFAAGSTLKAGVSPLAPALERYLGNRTLLDQLANDALDRADTLMSRAHALRRLESRFPRTVLASMAPADANLFSAIERDHLSALAAQATALERQLSPALASLGGSIHGASTQTDLFTAARRMERSLSMLFGSAEVEGDPQELPSRVLSDLALVQSLARRNLSSLTPTATSRD